MRITPPDPPCVFPSTARMSPGLIVTWVQAETELHVSNRRTIVCAKNHLLNFRLIFLPPLLSKAASVDPAQNRQLGVSNSPPKLGGELSRSSIHSHLHRAATAQAL